MYLKFIENFGMTDNFRTNEDVPSIKEKLIGTKSESLDNMVMHTEKVKIQKEDRAYRLAGEPPLITIIKLSSGPLCSNIVMCFYGVVSTIWISKALGTDGLAAVSIYSLFDTISRAFGSFLMTSASTQISALFGLERYEECHQVAADLYRVCIFLGIAIPVILLPTCKYIAKWLGADDKILNNGYNYLFPIMLTSGTTMLMYLSGGILQGEGNSLIFGICNAISGVTNMFVWGPLFLLVFKIGMFGGGLSTCLSDSIIGIVLTVLIFLGKYTSHPTPKHLIRPFSKNSLQAMKVGISQLIAQLSVTLPSIVVRKFIGMAANDDYDNTLSGFMAGFRYSGFPLNFLIAINQGFVPAASYAYQAKLYDRYIRLIIHAFWISLGVGTIFSLILASIPVQLAKLFGTDSSFVTIAAKMIRSHNWGSFALFSRYTCQGILQSLQMGWIASLTSLINQFVIISVCSVILYYTNKDDPSKIVLCYPLSYIFGSFLMCVVILRPMMKLYREAKEHKKMSEIPSDENDIPNSGINNQKNHHQENEVDEL